MSPGAKIKVAWALDEVTRAEPLKRWNRMEFVWNLYGVRMEPLWNNTLTTRQQHRSSRLAASLAGKYGRIWLPALFPLRPGGKLSQRLLQRP